MSNRRFQLNIYKILPIFLVLMTLESAVEFYSGQGVGWALLLYRLCGLIILLVAIDQIRKSRLIRGSYKGNIILYFIFLCLWSIIGFVYDSNVLSIFSVCIYFAIPLGVCLDEIDMAVFVKSFAWIAVIGVLVLVYIDLYYSIDILTVLRRGYTWTSIFFFGGVYWGIIPIVLYTLIMNLHRKYRLLVAAYWISGLIFNLIFLKRYIIVDSVLIILMILVYLFTAHKITIRVFLTGSCALLMVFFLYCRIQASDITPLLDGVVQRFSGESIKNFDRFVESADYFTTANSVTIFLGKGLWGTHTAIQGIHEALHVGWTNFIFKGGVFLFLFAVIPTLKAVAMLSKMASLDKKTQWAVCITCVYAVKLMYTNMHGFSPEMTFVFFAYAVVMKWKREGNELTYEKK